MGAGYIVLLLLLLTIYIVFTGSTSLYTVATGVIASIITFALFHRYTVKNPHKLLDVKRLGYLIAYLIEFIKAEIQCHIDVIKRIITGEISPGIVKVPYDLRSDYAVTLTACSITNTPGTVVVDIDENEKAYYVHWIYVATTKREEIRKQISYTFEKYAKKIFD